MGVTTQLDTLDAVHLFRVGHTMTYTMQLCSVAYISFPLSDVSPAETMLMATQCLKSMWTMRSLYVTVTADLTGVFTLF